jgi:hypothetical protein
MTHRKSTKINRLRDLLQAGNVRRADRDGRTFYAAVDVIAALTDSAHGAAQWDDLKRHEAVLDLSVESFRLPGEDGGPVVVEMLPLTGVTRLIQSLSSAKAERLKGWMAGVAAERVEEEANPELAVLRTRELYLRKGYSRCWIDSRVRSVSARHDLAGEWYRRGATEGEHFRVLTNELIKSGFGMEVEAYRIYKGLTGTRETLRDHMTDMELALTSLAEAAAVTLTRERNSAGFEALLQDVHDAGSIVGETRQRIEEHSGKPATYPGNYLDGTAPRGPRDPDRPARQRRLPGKEAEQPLEDAVAADSTKTLEVSKAA